ncbi:sigma-70 family RNA polymerase sigma factor [Calothrix sp. PCC 7507]|uniref:sigma-70 family RNA polymerase sigma factor n=1 Tax=Calothrix sp. PCC 7507 TaxID=99598 RepID=UPI00029EE215|nr:sigma-70 family RNA polymerase sigma factor [Calothrix sp. PCC 7507]AFY34506.1 RNA polymerase sigma factor, sigma-70 family [Calothrix sp. PCC 7507]
MQPRQDITDIFSTFVLFNADSFHSWGTDPKLRRSIKSCLEKSSQPESDNFWAIYWHQVWQTQSSPLAAAHISAYLQEVCYWVSRKIALNFPSQSSVADCFQIAISRVSKILKRFDPQYSSNLKGYAELAFEGFIKDSLRLRQETDICTDWGLLHKISRKRLIDALQNAGFNSPIIESYVLAWECFKELHTTTNNTKVRKLVEPDALTWQAIANLYNTQHLSQSSSSTPETLEKWLSISAKAVRAFLYPNLVSVDAPRNEQDGGSLLDIIPADVEKSLLNEIIAQEEFITLQKQTKQLQTVINQAITALDAQSQKLLQTYYSEKLTQQQIAQQLEIKQYQVSRRLSSIKRQLLQSLAQWSNETLHISPTPNVLDAMSTSLEEWLKSVNSEQ